MQIWVFSMFSFQLVWMFEHFSNKILGERIPLGDEKENWTSSKSTPFVCMYIFVWVCVCMTHMRVTSCYIVHVDAYHPFEWQLSIASCGWSVIYLASFLLLGYWGYLCLCVCVCVLIGWIASWLIVGSVCLFVHPLPPSPCVFKRQSPVHDFGQSFLHIRRQSTYRNSCFCFLRLLRMCTGGPLILQPVSLY